MKFFKNSSSNVIFGRTHLYTHGRIAHHDLIYSWQLIPTSVFHFNSTDSRSQTIHAGKRFTNIFEQIHKYVALNFDGNIQTTTRSDKWRNSTNKKDRPENNHDKCISCTVCMFLPINPVCICLLCAHAATRENRCARTHTHTTHTDEYKCDNFEAVSQAKPSQCVQLPVLIRKFIYSFTRVFVQACE